MCRAKSEHNYYRCEWKKLQAANFFQKVAEAACDVSVSMAVDSLGDTRTAELDKLGETARGLVVEAVTEGLGPRSRFAKRRQVASDIGRPEVHLLCGIAALVGEVCAKIHGLPAGLASCVEAEVKERTSSVVAGKLAGSVAKKLLEDVSTALDPVAQVRFLADVAAVGLCPAQQAGGVPAHHPEVQKSSERVEEKLTADFVDDLCERKSSSI